MIISGLQRAILIFIILVLLISALEFPKIKFGAQSAVFFMSDPAIHFLWRASRIFGLFNNNQNVNSPDDLNSIKLDDYRVQTQKIRARVLRVPPAVAFGNIIVASGSADGVAVGMKAILADDIFVGFVEEVFENDSRIQLLSSFGKIEQVRVGGIVAVSLEGLGGSLMKIELPRDIGLKVGEVIVIAADQPYIAGFVESIDFSGTKPLVAARTILPFNVYQLDHVFIVP